MYKDNNIGEKLTMMSL